MKFTEAFEKLGYKVDAPRTDWSAENDGGVCITIWGSEMKSEKNWAWFDTKLHAGSLDLWRNLPGNRKRIRHLQRVVDGLTGAIDVVIVKGTPGEGVDDAHPWIPRERGGKKWYITDFDPDTGHFAASTEPPMLA
jgi:hypothetical protein